MLKNFRTIQWKRLPIRSNLASLIWRVGVDRPNITLPQVRPRTESQKIQLLFRFHFGRFVYKEILGAGAEIKAQVQVWAQMICHSIPRPFEYECKSLSRISNSARALHTELLGLGFKAS